MMQRILSKVLLLMVAVSLGICVSVGAQSAKSYNKTVYLMAGKADTVELAGPVADVLVANPTIADVGTLRSNRLYIVGRAVGDTNVLAYDDAGNQLANITVNVRTDDKNLQNTLKEFFPDEKISAKTVKDNIVLSGIVSSPSVSNQVRDLAARFITDKNQTLVDLMTVRGEQQVMLKVKVIEAKRSVLRELGVETNFRTPNLKGLVFDGNDVGRTSNKTPFGTGFLVLGKKFGSLSSVLKALENNGMVNTLAEPNLTAISGESAGFLAGGEFPVPTSKDKDGNVILEFKPFGVSLNFTPTVLSKDRIGLHLSTEVSEKDNSGGITLLNITIPGLSVRKAETTVEVASGGTIMIAGLIKSDTLHTLDGLPGVQDLPILGELFKSKSFARNESELLIIVTPYLVDSYAEPDAVAEASEPEMLQTDPEAFSNKEPEMTTEKAAGNIKATSSDVPEKTERPVRSAKAEAGTSPLSQRLVDNLRKTYGKHMPEKVGAGQGFGYIVD
ncbi:MAG: type II and III secretion system protein family protein [Alphaproteobacteria bacterium]|nr:type II and III secretion system protein family protein [Alphaproteobacteria bacterium]